MLVWQLITSVDSSAVQPFWSGSVADFLTTPVGGVIGILAEAQLRHFRTNEVQQLRAWEESIFLLRGALAAQETMQGWWLLLEYPMLRLGRRADAILLTRSAILVLKFKIGAKHFAPGDREQVEDYALDLRDFHEGSRRHPIVPILVATEGNARPATRNFPIAAVWNVIDASAGTLPALLDELADLAAAPDADLDAAENLHA